MEQIKEGGESLESVFFGGGTTSFACTGIEGPI